MKELNYSFAVDMKKECFIINGIESAVMPGLIEMLHLSKEDFAKMILARPDNKNQYQFSLTIKELD